MPLIGDLIPLIPYIRKSEYMLSKYVIISVFYFAGSVISITNPILPS